MGCGIGTGLGLGLGVMGGVMGGMPGGGVRVSMNGNPMGQRVHIFRNGRPVNIQQKPDDLEKKIEIDIKQAYFDCVSSCLHVSSVTVGVG